MEFDDCDYACQQVPSRTRQEKVQKRDRDMVEKQRLAQRHECYERHTIIDNIVKPEPASAYTIDDVDRFNRDFCQDQKNTKQRDHELMLARAGARRKQQIEYEESIELRRKLEAEEKAKVDKLVAQHDFNQESVLYDPVTCVLPSESTDKGATQKTLDTKKEFLRDARARRIQHNANSTRYDPITGEERNFW